MSHDLDIIGSHTCIPALRKAPHVYQSTILRGSDGMLPPYCVVVGHRRRVEQASKYLDNVTLLNIAVEAAGLDGGRTSVAVGTYKGTPICLLEHQMGCAGVEIYFREIMSKEFMTTHFKLASADNTHDTTFTSDAKYVIRVGTCAALNPSYETQAKLTSDEKLQQCVGVYDLIVSSHVLGCSATDLQSLTGSLNFFDPEMLVKARSRFAQLGYQFEGAWPVLQLDHSFSIHLQSVAQAEVVREASLHKPPTVFRLGVVSKDSLYAEANEHEFIRMREEHNVGCSEMELSVLARLAQQKTLEVQDPVRVSMIATVLTVIPGIPWGDAPEQERVSQRIAMITAFEALHQLSLKHKV